jgi:hypothetical protein
MGKIMRTVSYAGCIVTLLAILTIGQASAAIVPFDGIDSSWLHPDYKGDPTGDWLAQINDVAPVRIGDDLQFQNRWYNGYAGTVDVRISYGGGQRYVCSGADEYVHYGINYGNYFPGSVSSVPFYATVMNCSEDAYNIVITHQYTYNGILYGSGQARGAGFRRATPEELAEAQTATPAPRDNATATATPAASSPPTPAPGFGFETMIMLACGAAIAIATTQLVKKGQG